MKTWGGRYFSKGVKIIKGLAITPPILGRISIGKVVEKNGKRLPEKDDQFTVTTQVQGREGWIAHPYDEGLRKVQSNNKIRAIPIRFLFNDPDLNLRAEYSLFDRTSGRPMCVGNGEQCKRFTASGMMTLPCPSPEGCDLAKGGACKPYGRLNMLIGQDENDVGTFIFRTTGFNSIRTLAARLAYYKAVSGNLLACMPLELRLRAKSTTQSHRTPIYYADITVREGLTLEESITEARQIDGRRKGAGFDQNTLDAAAMAGFANGAFEDIDDDVSEIVEEFYPEPNGSLQGGSTEGSSGPESVKAKTTTPNAKPSLREKLDRKACQQPGESK